MPTMIDGLPGVLQYTVIEEDIPGLLPLSFQEKQGAMINLRTNKLHLPHLRAVVPVHRTQGGHRTIDVTTGLTPVAFRVPGEVSHQFGLFWHQFVMGGTVENSIRGGNDQLVMKDDIKNMCRVTESIQKQHGQISKPTSHFTSPHNMVTICHQDTITAQDNDHLHLTESHFSGRPKMRQFEQSTLQHDQQRRSSRSQTRTSHDDPDQSRRDGGLGRDHGDRTRQIGGHLKATKTLDDNSQTPVPSLLDMFGLNERMQDSQGQVRTQGNALELLEVAMWVALTQHQTGRNFLLEHPAHAS